MATEDANTTASTRKDLTSVCVTSDSSSPLMENDVRIKVTTELIPREISHGQRYLLHNKTAVCVST